MKNQSINAIKQSLPYFLIPRCFLSGNSKPFTISSCSDYRKQVNNVVKRDGSAGCFVRMF